MREAFVAWRPKEDAMSRVLQCDAIVAEYMRQGLRLTLRQLYYQLVARAIIPNNEKSYKSLGDVLSRARLAGFIDWDAIEDRGRQARLPTEFADLDELVEAAMQSYRLPRWSTQEHYVELWVEKDALAGVLAPIARQYHVPMMVNKGYSSSSAMYEAAQRIRDRAWSYKSGRFRPITVFYLGDHDPSGEDMVRDIRDRLNQFGSGGYKVIGTTLDDLQLDDSIDSPANSSEKPTIEVEKLALTTAQVQRHNPPPNPTKLTDSRAAKYIEEHGYECWEVDALDPATLRRIITRALDEVIDQNALDEILEREEADKDRLRAVLGKKRGKRGKS